ncbi:hypothetical protein GQ54DRAFT_258560 [Martensiomyces pterosporus]|nr:hypothetical protein GQ54DRAFT_258560 [Martensiomyces pterosporus]
MLAARSASQLLLSRQPTGLQYLRTPSTKIGPIYSHQRWMAAPVHRFEKYSPEVVESDWYEWWQKRGLFKPQKSSNPSDEFTMLLPPPNVTGVLHIGHALTLSIQDAMARWNRMHGRSVNWVPGTDHAGISTQTVVEKKLKRESGQTRHDLGREAFIEKVWEWRRAHGDQIKQQTKSIGASLNWDQEYFTMDAHHSGVVRDAFIRLYDEGLIYRDTKMVNWSCALQSVISDIEVDKIPTEGRQLVDVPGHKGKHFGVLHKIAFQIVNPPPEGPGLLYVETTRPETMLGDVALAINSSDSRYKGLNGKSVLHPLLQHEIPIILDDVLVDLEYGTGVVKITPAHDVNDHACAGRHGLPIVSVFGPDGAVVSDPRFARFAGKTRWEARRAIIDDLTQANAYAGKADAAASVISKCSRSGDIIEPMLMPQWYVRCRGLAQTADDLVRSRDIELIPDRHRAIWHNWLNGIEDWCVSRQLWWGHRIPMYRVRWGIPQWPDAWIAAEGCEHAKEKALGRLSAEDRILASALGENAILEVAQDDDVLDTWFSSGLLPLTVFNSNAENGAALMPCTVQPGQSPRTSLSSVLETGQDILFFWVARMAMLCTYFAQAPPFATVLLHPMVRDSQGRKMSKSLGNVINPLDIINGADLSKLQETLKGGYLSEQELKKSAKEMKRLYPQGFQRFGADALRLTLLLYTQQTQQINMSLDNVKAAYYFCNKLWNTFRFVHMHAERLGIETGRMRNSSSSWLDGSDKRRMTVFDRALVSRLVGMLDTYNRAMEAFRPAAAADVVREFVQRDLCDRYIEVSKLALFGNTGATNQVSERIVKEVLMLGSLDIVLRSLHPFMPFLTEVSCLFACVLL